MNTKKEIFKNNKNALKFLVQSLISTLLIKDIKKIFVKIFIFWNDRS